MKEIKGNQKKKNSFSGRQQQESKEFTEAWQLSKKPEGLSKHEN